VVALPNDCTAPGGGKPLLTGHIAVAIGAHGLRRSIPLWFLILAAQLPDWADAVLCTAGVRPAIPGAYSHSFVAAGVLAIAAAFSFFVLARDPAGALLVGLVVVSHLLGDYLTGIKPTWPGGPLVGLSLYERPALDFLVEAPVIVAGWLLYRRSLPALSRNSRYSMALLAVLLVIQAAADIVLALTPTLTKC